VTDGTNTANIKLSGNYTQSQFAMSSYGSGGTLITVSSINNPSGTPINSQVTWIDGVSGDWNTISDWSYKSNSGVVTGVLPAPTDVAAISATGTYTVTSPFDQTIERLTTIKTATLAVTGARSRSRLRQDLKPAPEPSQSATAPRCRCDAKTYLAYDFRPEATGQYVSFGRDE